MIPAGSRVLVGLSGGPDSVALTLLLRELEPRVPMSLAGVVHVNHGLRDAAADDERFCGELAAHLGVPVRSVAADVRQLARNRRTSLEDAGRTARYEAFESARVELGADLVATGHTRDDQAETFLLRLIRGAGPRGLAGIYPVAGRTIRPLLDVRRDDLREFLRQRQQAFCEDESNRDLSIPRNRIRHELLPYLVRHVSPGVADVLAREAELARLDADYLDRRAIDLAASIVLTDVSGPASGVRTADAHSSPTTIDIDGASLAALHPALASRVARLALQLLAPDKFIGFDRVSELLQLAAGTRPALSLPGQQAERAGGRIVLTREPIRGFANSFRVLLSIPGEVTLEPHGWAVSAGSSGAHAADGLAVAVRADALRLPLAVRSRKRGDRFRPPGLGGRQRKLQDVLVDRKVPRIGRDGLPLVVDADDRIVWVVGVDVAEDFRVTEPSQAVIFLKARRLGGPG
jgi:tRNA(Ile)-lysidine synthase